MNAAMTIDEFNVFLKSKQGGNLLLDVLHKLTTIEKPEDVRAVVEARVGPLATWQGWAFA
ncbi:MAG: hypothetical protein CVU38_04335 [Chloroflexi bacterium HGW-Chloroflexi-1]|nr:MAG: hypothetical protein CVU38_04335 [Chloroflexi bacterium HGW-Chloroflexi-1]